MCSQPITCPTLRPPDASRLSRGTGDTYSMRTAKIATGERNKQPPSLSPPPARFTYATHLAPFQLSVAVEHLLRAGVALHGPVEHCGGGNEGDRRGVEPPPEHDGLGDGVALQPALRLQVKDLELPLGCFSCFPDLRMNVVV